MRRALLMLTVLATVVVACGDDDDGGETGAATVEGSAAAGDGDYCAALSAFKTSRDDFASAVASGTATPEEIEAAIAEQDAAFRVLLDAAPADIQGDMGALAGPMDAYIEALAEVDYDVAVLTTDNVAAAEALNQLDGPDYIEATESVDAYSLEHCDITLGGWQAFGQ